MFQFSGTLGISMLTALNRLLEKTTLAPEEAGRLTEAYKLALSELGLKDRDDPLTAIIAEKVIEAGQTGIQDCAEICRLAIAGVGTDSKKPIQSRQRLSRRSTRLRLLPTFLTAFFTAALDRPVFFVSYFTS
jgi:hypothetical protein